MLTDAKLRTIKPDTKLKRYSDDGGLCLEVTPAGGKHWRYRYRYLGKANMLAIGSYPTMGLAEARKKRDEAKAKLAQGIDPNQAKKEAKYSLATPNTFETLAMQWLEERRPTVTPKTHHRDKAVLIGDAIPFIGKRPIDQITSPMVLAIAKQVEARGALEMARRVIGYIGQVMRYAMRHGLCSHDPTTGLKEALKPRKVQHMARIDRKQLPELLHKIDTYDGEPLTRLGLKLLNLTFLRTNEVRFMEWDDVSFEEKEIRLPAERMKMGTPHIVPLSQQAIDVLKEIHTYTGNRKHVFYNTKSCKPYSENGFLTALWRMGYKGRMTGHGFRGLASTLLHEQGYMHDAIERQLAHSESNQVSAAYNHAQHLDYRRNMMQDWADYLDQLRNNVLVFPKNGSSNAT